MVANISSVLSGCYAVVRLLNLGNINSTLLPRFSNWFWHSPFVMGPGKTR